MILSTTTVQTWVGADLSTLGPIYPLVGNEVLFFILGLIFWLGFHVMLAGVEKREMEADEEAARSPDRLKRVFRDEANE